MKQLTLNGKEVLMVEVPKGAEDIHIESGCVWYDPSPLSKALDFQRLPLGDWHLLGLASELSEDEWKDLVEEHKIKAYKDYSGQYVWLHTSTESGISLIRSHGYNPATTILLTKK